MGKGNGAPKTPGKVTKEIRDVWFLEHLEGKTNQEIADSWGVNPATVDKWRRSDKWNARKKKIETRSARNLDTKLVNSMVNDAGYHLSVLDAAMKKAASDVLKSKKPMKSDDWKRLHDMAKEETKVLADTLQDDETEFIFGLNVTGGKNGNGKKPRRNK